MKPDDDCFVYTLWFPDRSWYVGITNDLGRRVVNHKVAARRDRGFEVSKAIKKFGWNRTVLKVHSVQKTRIEARTCERRLVREFCQDSKLGSQLNMNDGGGPGAKRTIPYRTDPILDTDSEFIKKKIHPICFRSYGEYWEFIKEKQSCRTTFCSGPKFLPDPNQVYI